MGRLSAQQIVRIVTASDAAFESWPTILDPDGVRAIVDRDALKELVLAAALLALEHAAADALESASVREVLDARPDDSLLDAAVRVKSQRDELIEACREYRSEREVLARDVRALARRMGGKKGGSNG